MGFVGKAAKGLVALAVMASAAKGIHSVVSPGIDDIKMFTRIDGPEVMRIYRPGPDLLLVEEPGNRGKYIPLSEYLATIPDRADREIERAKIHKAAEWYRD